MKITILLLAAGASSRMGGADKLAREIDGEPLLRRATLAALGSDANVVVVTTPDRTKLIHDLDVQAVAGGADMSDSLRAGLADLEADAVIISLADMPDITADHYKNLINAYDRKQDRLICRAISDTGTPGHPVLFDARFFGELRDITGDTGPKSVILRHSDVLVNVPTPGSSAVTDLDTEDDWEKYRK